MQIVTLYRYGSTTVSPVKPDEGVDYTITHRLIADNGMGLTHNGVNVVQCVDTDTPSEWREIPYSFADTEIMALRAENASLAQQVEMLESGVTIDD